MPAPEPIHPLAVVARGPYGAAGTAPLRVALPAREIVQVMARRGRESDLAVALRTAFGIDLPGPCRAISGSMMTAVWIQPGHWLLTAPRAAEGALAARAQAAFAGVGTVVDQSHGRTTISLSGPGARAVLSRGCRIDLHPRAFGPGHAVTTPIAQVACLLHQTDDAPTFELTVFSTLVEPFFRWLADAAADTGLLLG